ARDEVPGQRTLLHSGWSNRLAAGIHWREDAEPLISGNILLPSGPRGERGEAPCPSSPFVRIGTPASLCQLAPISRAAGSGARPQRRRPALRRAWVGRRSWTVSRPRPPPPPPIERLFLCLRPHHLPRPQRRRRLPQSRTPACRRRSAVTKSAGSSARERS